jgi:hypothetical protein
MATDALQSGTMRRLARGVVVFLIFALVGPPIAALIAIGIIPFFERGSIAPERIEDLIDGIERLVLMAYFFIGAQMGAMGLVAALRLFFAHQPRVSLILVLATGFVLAVIAIFILANPLVMPPPHPGIVAAVLVLHLGAAGGCGLIANALLRLHERHHTRMVAP